MKKRKLWMLVFGLICCTFLCVGCGCNSQKVTVTFDSDGGSAITKQIIEKNQTVSKPSNPTKEGYTFEEWLLNGEPYDFSKKVTADITLKASWSEKTNATQHTVTFDSNGGSSVANKVINDGKKLDKPVDPTKKGYTFLGWYLEDSKYDFTTPVRSDITLTAKWEKQDDKVKFVVTFDSNGGSKIASKTVADGSKVTKPSNPTRTGYRFLGWYYNNQVYNFQTVVTKNMTLVAKWEKLSQYTVTFDSNGGNSVAKQTVYDGYTATKPKDPTRQGYKFIGWQLNGQNYNFATKVSKNITLIAKWEKIEDTYTARFIPYSTQTPEIGVIQIFKNGEATPIVFLELLNTTGGYVGKYNTEDKGMRNGNEIVLKNVAKVKLADGSIVNIKK